MKFAFYIETHRSCVLITPLVASSLVLCDSCPTVHGFTLDLGWFIWTASLEVISA